MDSMRDLNNWGDQYQLYEDGGDKVVVFSGPQDLNVQVYQNTTWTPPLGENDVVQADSVANNCTFTVDVGDSGGEVIWKNALP